tara:strand:+ start:2702 stop:3661 length:960 start_codon:yes stop_codon:yes gene_type:complete
MPYNIYLTYPLLFFILGAMLLYYGSEYLIDNSTIIAKKFNIPAIVIGVTIIAIGTSLPELIISIKASFLNNADLVIGNIVGSNIANLSLVFAVIMFFEKFIIDKTKKLFFNIYFLIFITGIFIFFISSDNLYKINGVFLLIIFFVYIYFLIKYIKSLQVIGVPEHNVKSFSFIKVIVLILIGILFLSFGSDMFIGGSLGIAQMIGINNVSLGLTLVALGTSIPELIVSINAAKKAQYDYVLGNILGSNIINIALIGGITSIINDIKFNSSQIKIDYILLILLTISFPSFLSNNKKFNRFLSLIFISIYLAFLYINFLVK